MLTSFLSLISTRDVTGRKKSRPVPSRPVPNLENIENTVKKDYKFLFLKVKGDIACSANAKISLIEYFKNAKKAVFYVFFEKIAILVTKNIFNVSAMARKWPEPIDVTSPN